MFYTFCTVNSQDICKVQGECQEGFQLDNVAVSSYYECQITCQQTQYCNYYTYFEPIGMCTLLYNCTDIDAADCPECFTGEKDCLICDRPGECQGMKKVLIVVGRCCKSVLKAWILILLLIFFIIFIHIKN